MTSAQTSPNSRHPLFAASDEPFLADGRRFWPVVFCGVLLAAAAFSGPVDIGEGATGELQSRLAKTPSVAFKVATALGAGVVGFWGIACIPRARQILFSLPGLCLCGIATVFILSCLTSITSASLPIALVNVAYLMFLPTCLVVLGLRGTLQAVLWGVLLFTLAALLLYFVFPLYGVFPEDFGDGIVIERLGGMSQPNHTGRSATLGFLITAYFFRLPRSPKALCVLLMAIFGLAAALAMSRTALLAGGVCLAILNVDRLMTRAGMSIAFLGLLVLGGGLFALGAVGGEEALTSKLLGALTKTGDVEEVTQVTGRSEIWERAILLIKGRPLQGYGLGAVKTLLVDHLQSTHNILLHPTLAAGVVAGGLTLLLLMWNLLQVFVSPQLIVRALSAYILISGLTEDTIYETFPGPCSLLWLACCLWPVVLQVAPSERMSHDPSGEAPALLAV